MPTPTHCRNPGKEATTRNRVTHPKEHDPAKTQPPPSSLHNNHFHPKCPRPHVPKEQHPQTSHQENDLISSNSVNITCRKLALYFPPHFPHPQASRERRMLTFDAQSFEHVLANINKLNRSLEDINAVSVIQWEAE